MGLKDVLKRRFFRILLILAWLALGTVMVVLQGTWWLLFAIISYAIAAIYIVAEVLTWKYMMSQGNKPTDQNPPESGQGGNSG